MSLCFSFINSCDFCAYKWPRFEYAAREFYFQGEEHWVQGKTFTGAWWACRTCSQLIEEENLPALVRKAMLGVGRVWPLLDAVAAEDFYRVFRLFLDNRVGSRIPLRRGPRVGRDPANRFG